MARDFQIPGECLVQVKGMAGTGIGSLAELGLSADPITVTPRFRHKDMNVDAWGEAPADVQFMLAEAFISMNLVHYDESVLDVCLRESMGGGAGPGTFPRAGTRLGGGVGRFVTGNHYIGLNITSPVQGKPWRFYFTYLADTPIRKTLGVEKSIVQVNFRAVPYTTDPYGGGTGAAGTVLWDHTLDT